jgi:regulator of protease activity HflC (stomatin/prohibitin superfamily)
MTDEQKTDIEACLADLDLVTEKVDEILEGGVSLTDVDLLATDAEIKAAEMLEKIKADLSEDELAAAEARIEELKNLQAELTAEFEERLAKAEMDAKKYIEDAREARKNTNSAN